MRESDTFFTDNLNKAKAIALNLDDCALGNVVWLTTNHNDFDEIGVEVKSTILSCQTEEEYKGAAAMLLAITGCDIAKLAKFERRLA